MTPEGRRTLLRGYLASTAVYVAGHVALWAVLYRHLRAPGVRDPVVWVVLAILCITFVAVTGWLALAPTPAPVLSAAAVSTAAVLTAGLARTGMAALGMREFLWWDHDNVLAEAALENVFVALACFPPAAAVAALSWLLFGRRRRPMNEPIR
jgi:cytochrome b subunit of formate dehydrogenase